LIGDQKAKKMNSRILGTQAQAARINESWWHPICSPLSFDDSKFRIQNSKFTLYPLSVTLVRSTACLLLAAYCLMPTVVHAQGCAMCYTSASAAQSTAKQALANGTLILLVPPVLFFAVITVVLYLYRNKYRDESFARNSESTIRSLISADAQLPAGNSPADSLRISTELRYLENDSTMMAADDGQRPMDKVYQKS
jgi:hypothetical protein